MKIIKLPWPPSVNAYWRSVNGRNILSSKGRKFKNDAQAAMVLQRSHVGDAYTSGMRLEVIIKLCPPTDAKRDVDNFVKAVLDCLTGVAYEDDSQIDRLVVWRGDKIPGGGVDVTVRLIDEM